ncbi:MAG: PGF-pre-PGF domain-containing protein, partial [Candidatus Hadarchaeota archaeon]
CYSPSGFVQPPAVFGTGHTYAGVDNNADTKYEYLAATVNLNITTAGTYKIFADLSKQVGANPWDRKWIDWTETKVNLSAGVQSVTLLFRGEQIYNVRENAPYEIKVFLYGPNWEWYGENKIDVAGLNYNNFQSPSIEFSAPHTTSALDTDNDGLYNYIVENVRVKVNNAGKYRIGGMISRMATYGGPDRPLVFTMTEVNLNTGDNQIVQLTFDASRIYSSRENGPYFVGIGLLDNNFNPITRTEAFTPAYTYNQFEQPIAELNPPHSDYGIDNNSADNDNRFDFLEIKVRVSVRENGTYTLAGEIWHENWSTMDRQPIDWRENKVYLAAGSREVTLRFDGYGIVKNNVQGKMYAEIVLLNENNAVLDMTIPAYQTNFYLYTNFKPTKTVQFAIAANLPVPTVPAGQTASVDVDDNDMNNVMKLDITARDNLSGAKLGVTEHDNKPPGAPSPSGSSLGYLDITMIGSENIRTATIYFKVKKTVVAALNLDPDNLGLMHYNENMGMWETLETILENEDNEYYYYYAITPGFSWFVIIGTVQQEQQGQQQQQQQQPQQQQVSSPGQATFEFSVFSIPDSIKIGEKATITFTVRNSGSASGTYAVILSLDNRILENRAITLAAGESQDVSFEVVPTATGTFVIQIAGQTSSLVVAPLVTVTQDLVSITAPEVYASKINIDAPAVLDISATSITQIVVNVSKEVSNIILKVKQLIDKPAQIETPEGTVYTYLEILAEKLNNSDISSALVNFRVEKSWVAQENIDTSTIVLKRYTSAGWQTLATEKTSEDNSYIYFAATTPGFSVFAVSGSKAGSTTAGPGITPTLPTLPTVQIPPIYLVGFTAIVLVVVILAVIWRYISIGSRGLVKQEARRKV